MLYRYSLTNEQSFLVKPFLQSEFSSAFHNIEFLGSKAVFKGHYTSFWAYDRLHCHNEKK